jgi:large subunit ribosomal protein L20
LHAYVGRKLKKREYRRLWITRINAAARLNGTTYSKLMYMLKVNNININRKILADFAMNKPEVFAAIVKQATKQ